MPGFVFCGQVIRTSIKVKNDLADCLWDGLVVGAHDITIDLDGHTIDGKGVAAGIRNDGYDNVTIKNGKILEFDWGVMLNPGTEKNIVEQLEIQQSQEAGIGLGHVPHPTDMLLPLPPPPPSSFDSKVIGNILRFNTIVANDIGIWLAYKTKETLILENEINVNPAEGVMLERSHGNRIEGNTIFGSSGSAVLMEGSNNNTVVSNDLSENRHGVLHRHHAHRHGRRAVEQQPRREEHDPRACRPGVRDHRVRTGTSCSTTSPTSAAPRASRSTGRTTTSCSATTSAPTRAASTWSRRAATGSRPTTPASPAAPASRSRRSR